MTLPLRLRYIIQILLVLWLHVLKRPVGADPQGRSRFSNALTRVEERWLRYIECAPPSLSLSLPIPDHESWIVTMWHFV